MGGYNMKVKIKIRKETAKLHLRPFMRDLAYRWVFPKLDMEGIPNEKTEDINTEFPDDIFLSIIENSYMKFQGEYYRVVSKNLDLTNGGCWGYLELQADSKDGLEIILKYGDLAEINKQLREFISETPLEIIEFRAKESRREFEYYTEKKYTKRIDELIAESKNLKTWIIGISMIATVGWALFLFF